MGFLFPNQIGDSASDLPPFSPGFHSHFLPLGLAFSSCHVLFLLSSFLLACEEAPWPGDPGRASEVLRGHGPETARC